MSPNAQFIVMLGIAAAAGAGYLLPNGITLPKWPIKKPEPKDNTPDWYRAKIKFHQKAIEDHNTAIELLREQAGREAAELANLRYDLDKIAEDDDE